MSKNIIILFICFLSFKNSFCDTILDIEGEIAYVKPRLLISKENASELLNNYTEKHDIIISKSVTYKLVIDTNNRVITYEALNTMNNDNSSALELLLLLKEGWESAYDYYMDTKVVDSLYITLNKKDSLVSFELNYSFEILPIDYYKKVTYKYGQDSLYALLSTIEYPKELIDLNIQGFVVLQLSINNQGYITNIDLVRSVHPKLNQIAIKSIIKTSGEWVIADDITYNLREYKLLLPFKFSL